MLSHQAFGRRDFRLFVVALCGRLKRFRNRRGAGHGDANSKEIAQQLSTVPVTSHTDLTLVIQVSGTVPSRNPYLSTANTTQPTTLPTPYFDYDPPPSSALVPGE